MIRKTLGVIALALIFSAVFWFAFARNWPWMPRETMTENANEPPQPPPPAPPSEPPTAVEKDTPPKMPEPSDAHQPPRQPTVGQPVQNAPGELVTGEAERRLPDPEAEEARQFVDKATKQSPDEMLAEARAKYAEKSRQR